MMIGKCVNNNNSLVLILGKEYYLLPYGETHYYVSNFSSGVKSNMGCFQKSRFEILESNGLKNEKEIDYDILFEEEENGQLSLF